MFNLRTNGIKKIAIDVEVTFTWHYTLTVDIYVLWKIFVLFLFYIFSMSTGNRFIWMMHFSSFFFFGVLVQTWF